MAIAERANDWIGIRSLIQTYRGPQFATEMSYHSLDASSSLEVRAGFRHNGTGVCAVWAYAFNNYGFYIRGSADATNPNTFEIGQHNTDTGTVRWPLGFDPDNVRLEIYFTCTRVGGTDTIDITAPVVNGNTLTGGTKAGNRNALRVYKLLNQSNSSPFGLGDIFHLQFAYDGTPSTARPAQSRWFLDEGSGETGSDEDTANTLTYPSATEGVDFEWIDETPVVAAPPIYKHMQNLEVY